VLRQGIIICVALTFAGLLSAGPIPQSSCTFFNPSLPNDGFSCNLYPSNASGGFDGDAIIQFPSGWSSFSDPITPGYIVLTDNAANLAFDPNNLYGADDPNESDWTQILAWQPVNGVSATYMELFTVGCTSKTNPNDTSCFPSYNAIMASAYFDVEPSSGVYDFDPCPGCTIDHAYVVNFIADPVSATPEPSTLAIALGGIAVLAGLNRKKYSRR
jgi:hypothetical protein